MYMFTLDQDKHSLYQNSASKSLPQNLTLFEYIYTHCVIHVFLFADYHINKFFM